MNRGGRFVDVTDELAPGLAKSGLVQSALWSDVDQDGWPDLLVVSHWEPIRCWRNLEGQGFEDASEKFGFTAAGSGWWNSIAAADFNGDGRIDYAVGNLGLNTRYRASRENPAQLYAGVFEDGGAPVILEAETLGGRPMPLRGRDQVSAALPSVRRRLPTYAAYAAASLADIVGDERLQSAHRVEATEFRSGIFLSSDATAERPFEFQVLPRMAQLAPIFGLVAGDFNADGNADLYAVQNTHAPHPEIGRFAGGLGQLLHGDGRGNFDAIAAHASGLVVPGEARALAVTDMDEDGRADFVVTRQNATVLAFRNRSGAPNNAFIVRLVGEVGNLSAIGARITVTTESGKRTAAEIHAGGGYLTQSTAGAIFGFTDDDRPREITVAWPDGSMSTHLYRPGETTLLLRKPAL